MSETFISFIKNKPPCTPLPIEGIELVEKNDWILKQVVGQKVLHLGPTDSPMTSHNAKAGRLLHQLLQGKCLDLVGLDLDAGCVELLRKQHGIHDIIVGDAEKLPEYFPGRTFDLVIAGDIIEHVNNLGLVLQGVKKILNPSGRLIVTTPNALAIKRVLGAALLRQERNNPDHLYFYSPMNLWQAANRFGFELHELKSFMYRAPGCKFNAVGNLGAKILMRLMNNFALADELAAVFAPSR